MGTDCNGRNINSEQLAALVVVRFHPHPFFYVVYQSITTPLIHKHLGVGVYELKKNMKVYFEKIGEEPVFTPSWY